MDKQQINLIKKKNQLVISIFNNFIWEIFIVIFLIMILSNKFFFTPRNLVNVLFYSAILGVLAIGQSFCLMTGKLDLSQEATLAFAVILGTCFISEELLGELVHPMIAIIIALLSGGLIGLINGFFIVKVRMNPLITTFAMSITLRGIAIILTSGKTISGLPRFYTFLGQYKVWQIPLMVFLFIGLFILAEYILRHRSFGRNVLIVGGNIKAAIESGIKHERVIIIAYVFSGILAALGGIMMAGQYNSVNASMGTGMTFMIFAACVIGGVSLRGGVGNFLGVLGGVLLLGVIDNGLKLMNVSAFWMQTISGLLILFAINIDSIKYSIIHKAEMRIKKLYRQSEIVDREGE